MAFANSNDNYIANLRQAFTHEHGEEICLKLKDFLENHWDFQVLVRRSTGSSYGCVLEIEVERGYTNLADYAAYIMEVFAPSFKNYVNYIVVQQLHFEPILWPEQIMFTVNNAQKTHGYKDLQINHGGRYYYQPEIPSNINVPHYLDTGETK